MFNIIKKIASFDICPVKYMPMTSILVLINIIVFILEVMNPNYIEPLVHQSGVWYTYITSIFMHASIEHLAGNMLFLCFICYCLERNYGSLFLFIAYLVTGIGGGLVTALYCPLDTGLGASGSIFGLMMLWIFHNLLMRRPLIVLAALFMFMQEGMKSGCQAAGFSDGIGHLAHYGSAIFGFFMLRIMVYKHLRK